MLPNSNKGTSKELEKQLNLDMLAYLGICRNRQLLWKRENVAHTLLKAVMSSQINVLDSPTPPPSPP